MVKKNQKQKPKKRTTKAKQNVPQSMKRSNLLLLALFAGGVLVLIGAYFLYSEEKQVLQISERSELKKTNAHLRENRPTLPPQRFSGTFRMAYEVARAIPEVLDELYCYCRCQENLGHKNLLSCYVDTHAST